MGSSSKKRGLLLDDSRVRRRYIDAIYAPASDNALLTPWLRFDSLARVFTIFFLAVGLSLRSFHFLFSDASTQLRENIISSFFQQSLDWYSSALQLIS